MPLALLYLDLNGFKGINDTLGHAAGDAVLLAVSATLKRATREQDSVARWGGEEFLLMLRGPDAAQRAEMRRTRVGVVFQQPNLLASLTAREQLLLTAHIGGQDRRRRREAARRADELLELLGEVLPEGAIGLRLYYKPLVLLIWLGAVVMALGGAISLTDRRMRVGAPARARAKPVPPGMAPAE